MNTLKNFLIRMHEAGADKYSLRWDWPEGGVRTPMAVMLVDGFRMKFKGLLDGDTWGDQDLTEVGTFEVHEVSLPRRKVSPNTAGSIIIFTD